MSCAQRGIDSATAAADLEAAGEGVPGSLVPPTVSTGGTPIAYAGSTGPRTRPVPPSDTDLPRRSMLGWAVMVNALTMARHRATEDLEAAA